MYLKIKVDELGQNWKIFGGVRHLNYSSVNNWDWPTYLNWCEGADYYAGPTNEEEWNESCVKDGMRYIAHAGIYFEDGNYMFVLWDTVAYLLNEDGKTIEVIPAA